MTKTTIENAIDMMELAERADNAKLNDGNANKSTKTKTKSNAPTQSTPQPKPVIDLTEIMAQLPTDKPITPSTLDKLFQLNDGGKTIRRHLRKHYATNHEHKSSWAWAINDPMLTEILAHFASKYQIAK